MKERLPVDGRSLMGLLDGSDAENWQALSEYHSQGAHAPCFMIRQGSFKYVSIYGYESQLFDLEADPGEWHNLAGQPEYASIEQQLKACLLEQFDADAIEASVLESVQKRALVMRAMQITSTRWDFEPRFDPTAGISDRYLPGKRLSDIPR
jgi:choline-sulfatase